MTVTFPIKIAVNHNALTAFQRSEEGSWQDSPQARYSAVHGYQILNRCRGAIIVHDSEEAAEVYWRVCSGTFQINAPQEGKLYFKTARRIANKLRPAVSEQHPEVVAMFPGPDGY